MSGRRLFIQRFAHEVPDLAALDCAVLGDHQFTLCSIPIVEYWRAGCRHRIELVPPLYPEEDCEYCHGRWVFPEFREFVLENRLEGDADYQLFKSWLPLWAERGWPAGRYAVGLDGRRIDGATRRR